MRRLALRVFLYCSSLAVFACSESADAPEGSAGGGDHSGGASGGSDPGSGGTHAGGAPGDGSGGTSSGKPPSGDCLALVTDPDVNWDESALQTDREIVECLATTLGRPVGYGERALGGFDPAGNSKLTIIRKGGPLTVEEQILEAISGDEHNWIVFDKRDFAERSEIGLYRLHCQNAAVLDHLDATPEECVDYTAWCAKRGITGEAECLEEFFNKALNESSLPIRNPVVGSNKTIDGRMSEAFFRFSGFAVGADSSGEPTATSSSVIFTHLRFEGAGHTEDHALDPDMIRSTGASHDIWIHKNDFDLTGDSAFDVKVGAHHVTMSFNRVVDVKRAALHGSSDSRVINEQIRTTMHHNAFVTRDAHYQTFGNTGRRVPLLRRGTSHLFDNVFVNYRKEVLSLRVGASLLMEDNAFVVNQAHQEKASVEASLAELRGNLIKDIGGGNFRAEGTALWFSDGTCLLDPSTETPLDPASGEVADPSLDYSSASRKALAAARLPAGQALVDYVSKTAGKYGALPFNSPLAPSIEELLGSDRVPCQ